MQGLRCRHVHVLVPGTTGQLGCTCYAVVSLRVRTQQFVGVTALPSIFRLIPQ